MAKKKKKIDTILKRAENLFKTGNFLLAEKEFKKVEKRLNSNEIAEKLEICRKETRAIKAKDLVKQGHKAVKNDKLSEAISCFQGAEKLLNAPWLTAKIKELQNKLTWNNIDAEAGEAEATHDYLKASELYLKAWGENGHPECLLKGAFSFVKAERYAQAAAMFQKLDLPHDQAIYYYGFALAKIGKYYEALKQWKKLDTHDKTFIEQKHLALSLACFDLYNTIGKEPDINEVYKRADDLLVIANTMSSTKQISILEKICSYYRLALIENLWKKKEFVAIADLLLQMTVTNDPAILALNAKTYFHLAGEDVKFLEPMMTFWLTAIYSKDISARFSDIPDKREKVQHQLISIAEQRINSQPDSLSARHAASYLVIEKKLIKDLLAISRKQGLHFDQVCTPEYATINGLSDIILDLIKQNKNFFKNREHYLETGGYYSRAGKSLYALKTGNVKKALNSLAAIEFTASKDAFTDYVIRLVQFEFGQVAMKNSEKNYLQYFALTSKLFESAPSIEKRFTDKILQYDGDQLICYEKILTLLYKQRRSDSIAEALSSVMTKTAIIGYNRRKITSKQIKVALEKALKIYPDNELAVHTLEQTVIRLEINAVYNAMAKSKLNKAAGLARQSAYPEVCDQYFEFVEQLIDQVDDSGLDYYMQKNHLHNLLNTCMTVDPDHIVIDSIKDKIHFLGD